MKNRLLSRPTFERPHQNRSRLRIKSQTHDAAKTLGNTAVVVVLADVHASKLDGSRLNKLDESTRAYHKKRHHAQGARRTYLQEKFVRFSATGMVAAAVLLVSAGQSEARPKNELVTFSGFGAPVTVGGETYPQVSITPGTDTSSGNGAIYITTGNGSSWTFNAGPCTPPNASPEGMYQGHEIYGCGPQKGYVEFKPQYFQDARGAALGQPFCVFSANIAGTVAFLNAASSDLGPGDFPINSTGAEYFQDATGAWHVGVTYLFEASTPGVPYEIDFICPQN